MNIQIKIGAANVVRGHVTATGADGIVRLLQPHTPIFQDDVIQTAEGNAAIAFTDGSHMFLGRNSDIQLDPSIYDPSEFPGDSQQPPAESDGEEDADISTGIHAVGNLMFCSGNSDMRLTDIAGMPIDEQGDSTIKGQYGSLHIDANCAFRYTVDSSNADIIALGNGDSLTDSFNYNIQRTADLGNAATLEITILGTEEAPIIGSVSTYSQRIHTTAVNASENQTGDSASGAIAFIPDSETQQLLDSIDEATPTTASEAETAEETTQTEEQQQQLEASEPVDVTETTENPDELETKQAVNESAPVEEPAQPEASDAAHSAETESKQPDEPEQVVVIEPETTQQFADEEQPPVVTSETDTEHAPVNVADEAQSSEAENKQDEEQVVVIEPEQQAITAEDATSTTTNEDRKESTPEAVATGPESEQPEEKEQVVVIEPENQEQAPTAASAISGPDEPITSKQPEPVAPVTAAITPAAAPSPTSNDNPGMGSPTNPPVSQPVETTTEAHGSDTNAIIRSIDNMKRLPMEAGDSLILSLQDTSEITNGNSGLIITGNASNEISIAAYEWTQHDSISIDRLNYTLFKGRNDEILLIDESVTVNKESFS